ncbi:MAG: hypothetical protein E7463_11380 [Ruminococcaceae bacterium]|nr:hypothetical protein [Oscillospiraceae bacterium]
MRLRPRILIPAGLLVLICAGLIAFRTLSAPKLPETLRPFPYPYTAMLALQSHIDGTTPEEYEAVHAYLNGRENTVYGDGLSMDVGDSLWLYADNNGVSYRTGDTRDISEYMTWYNGLSDEENDADLIREGVQKGWIDSMHTYGDFSRVDTEDVTFTRELAERAIRTLQDNDIYMKIWINHGNEANRQNFGGWLPFLATSYQAGSDPDSAWYHTDLLLDYGIRYLWNSHNSGRFGQTDPLFIITLRDGQKLWGFNAYTGYRKGLQWHYTWNPTQLAAVLTDENLDALADNYQFSIIATHFGSDGIWEVLGEHNTAAFRRLKSYWTSGRILVARSERLLDYAALRRSVAFENDGTHVDITEVNDPISGSYVPTAAILDGLTFYVDDAETAVVTVGGEPVDEIYLQRNPADETGRESIGFRWHKD